MATVVYYYSFHNIDNSNTVRGKNMIDFTHPHGLEFMIMQTDEDADRVIALFASAAAQGYENPVEIESEVYRQAGVDPSEFNYLDRQKIQSAVNKLWGVK